MSSNIDFDRIYHEEVVEALKNDTLLNWPARQPSKKYLSGGTCQGCGEKELFISLEKPYKLKCNRTNQCQYEEKTRDRYSDLFENLSERYPKTEENPNTDSEPNNIVQFSKKEDEDEKIKEVINLSNRSLIRSIICEYFGLSAQIDIKEIASKHEVHRNTVSKYSSLIKKQLRMIERESENKICSYLEEDGKVIC